MGYEFFEEKIIFPSTPVPGINNDQSLMSIKRALNKESSYEIPLKLDEKCSRGISYSSQILFFQSLHYRCFSSGICPLQVPAPDTRV